MRVISEERLIELKDNDCYTGIEKSVICELISDECKELNPWMTLEEFLKSGFVGKCWVFKIDQEIQFTEYYESIAGHKVFAGHTGSIPHNRIQKVWPIRKPEPPR